MVMSLPGCWIFSVLQPAAFTRYMDVLCPAPARYPCSCRFPPLYLPLMRHHIPFPPSHETATPHPSSPPPIPLDSSATQSSPVSTRLDARGAALRAVHALCLSCWPRAHAHASKLLCALLWTCGDCARRAAVRDGAEAAARLPLGVALAANHATIDAATDEAVRVHATGLGALVLVLAGGGGDSGDGGGGGGPSSARETLRQICAAVSPLRPAGSAMEQLADRVLLSEGEDNAESAADVVAGGEGLARAGGSGGGAGAGKGLDRAATADAAAYPALRV